MDKIDTKQLIMNEIKPGQQLKVSVKDADRFLQLVKVLRESVKKDQVFRKTLKVSTCRKDIATVVIKSNSQLPKGFASLNEVVVACLKGCSSADTASNESDEGQGGASDYIPYDFSNSGPEWLSLSGEEFCINAAHIQINPSYGDALDDDDPQSLAF